MKILRSISILPLVIAFCNCNPVRDIDKIKAPAYNPDVAFPLINSEFDIRDILNNFDTGGYIDSVDDGIIAVVYRGKAFSVQGDAVYVIPSIANVPAPTPNNSFPYPALGNEKIKKIIFKSGKMVFTLTNKPNMFAGTVNLQYNLTNFKQPNNQSLSQTFVVPANTGGSNQTLTHEIDLTGITLDLTNDNIEFNYNAKLASNNQSVTIPSDVLKFGLNNGIYSYLEGVLPNFQFGLEEKNITLDVFKNFVSGQTIFRDPRINLIVDNSYGISLLAKTDKLKASNVYGFSQDFVSSYNNLYQFPAPTIPGNSAVDTFKFYGTNSNVEDVIASAPQTVTYKVSAELNPTGTATGFVTDSSNFSVFVDVALPMWGKSQGVAFQKDFNADLKPFAAMDSASFKLITDNGFPLDLKAQLYFLGTNGVVLDSLFINQNKILTSATVDANGRATTPTTTTNFATLSGNRFENVKNKTKFVRLKARTNTINNGGTDIKIYTDNGMHIKLGVAASVDILQLFK